VYTRNDSRLGVIRFYHFRVGGDGFGFLISEFGVVALGKGLGKK